MNPDRRRFLAMGVAALFSVACENVFASEAEKAPKMGDIVKVGDKGFLLRNGKTYSIPNLERYLYYTKADQYGRRPIKLSSITNVTNKFPLTPQPKYDFVLDIFAGNIKAPKEGGGEINFYGSGFLTADDKGIFVPSEEIRPNSTFFPFEDKLKKEGGFDFTDSVYFSYGENHFGKYKAQDTFRDPKKNIDFALKQFEQLMIDFPLCQFNLVGHSLGGLFCLAIAMKYPYAINNLILLSSPVRGVERTKARDMAQKIKEELPFIGDEKVSEYLFTLWENETFKRGLDQFGENFTKSGKKMLVAVAEDDPIIPKESVMIKGADTIVLPAISSSVSNIQGHGRTLVDLAVLNPGTQRIGKNLARV